MPRLTIRLLGPLSISIDEQPVRLPRPRAEAVLYYCLDIGKPVSDESLRDLLWPEESKDAAQKLSEAISHVNRAIQRSLQQAGVLEPPQVCVRDLRQRTVTFTWPLGDLDYDVATFERLVKSVMASPTEVQAMHALQQACALYHRGPFLGTFYVQDADASFDDWITARRSALESSYLKLLQPLSIHCIAHGVWPDALEYLQRLQQSCPDMEVVYGLLMVCSAATGDIAQAQETYRQYVRMMDELHRSPPNGAITQLHHIIRDGHLAPMQVRALVDRALQIKRHLMHAPLQVALQEVFKATGVKTPPGSSAGYQQVLHRAQEEALRHGSNFVGTPYLFLALYAVDDGTVHDYWITCVPSLDTVAQTVRTILEEAPALAPAGNQELPKQTLSLQRILRVAQDLAEESEAATVDVPHLWTALLKEERGLLRQVLTRYGVEPKAMLKEMEQTLE